MGLVEAGARLGVGDSNELEFALGIRAVAVSQSMSSAFWRRV